MSSSMSPSLPELETLITQHSFLTLESSNSRFLNAPGEGLPLLVVNTPACHAVIALQGAHLLEFTPVGAAPLLWLSPNCVFTAGNALRGGVPVCLPWFGPNREDPSKPKHGFARNTPWNLTSVTDNGGAGCELTFTLVSAPNALFAYAFTAQLKMTLGKTAKLELSMSNTDSKAFACSWALHSYHPVSSLEKVRVKGLSGRDYLDNLEGHARKHQAEDVRFDGEVDRVFPGIENSLSIEEADSTKPITITHHNCPSVIVWNPGATNAAKIADIGPGQEQHYICVERGAVLSEEWQIASGATQSAWLEIA